MHNIKAQEMGGLYLILLTSTNVHKVPHFVPTPVTFHSLSWPYVVNRTPTLECDAAK